MKKSTVKSNDALTVIAEWNHNGCEIVVYRDHNGKFRGTIGTQPMGKRLTANEVVRWLCQMMHQEAQPLQHADPVMMHTVDEWIRSNRLIQAIKRRRIDTSEGLLEAKNYVERRRNELTANARYDNVKPLI